MDFGVGHPVGAALRMAVRRRRSPRQNVRKQEIPTIRLQFLLPMPIDICLWIGSGPGGFRLLAPSHANRLFPCDCGPRYMTQLMARAPPPPPVHAHAVAKHMGKMRLHPFDAWYKCSPPPALSSDFCPGFASGGLKMAMPNDTPPSTAFTFQFQMLKNGKKTERRDLCLLSNCLYFIG